jgi:23S rRNA (uracil1939-C5)-methyltransferase
VKPLSIEVHGLSTQGDGIATLDGKTVFVPGTLPGERVEATRARSGLTLVTVLTASAERETPRCPVFDRCGGCTWQHVSASLQRDTLLATVRRALPAVLRDTAMQWHPSPARWRWRTRARLAWFCRGNDVTLGHRARKHHDLIDVRACPVLDEALEQALVPLATSLPLVGGRGEVSLALGQRGHPVAVLYPEGPLDARAFTVCDALVRKGFAGATLWPSGASAPTTVGDARPITVGGDGAPLQVAPDGFAQANVALNPVLGRTVVARADAASLSVLELYAGSGNFTVALARVARNLVAVESDPLAAVALRENLRARAIEGVRVEAGDAARHARARADVLVLDPPRTGAREVCDVVVRGAGPRRIVYVSCDPATLGRDLAVLSPRYALRALDVFEMFPHAGHVEVVATLTRTNTPSVR